MADEKPTLHIDTDWKKQAQEEKRKLVEQEKQQSADPVSPPGASGMSPSDSRGISSGASSGVPGGAPGGASGASRTRPGAQREMPPPSFAALVQSIVTQVLYYLGELTPRGAQPTLNLDLAKHNIDTLAIIEEKTVNNLSEEEKKLLDAALYETRMRYVNVSAQLIS